MHFNEMILY